jgi:Flp pilus assembly protein TadB
MKYVELFRHTDNDGDQLTPDGVSAAEAIGRDRLSPPYDAFVSSGAARATQMLEILRRVAASGLTTVWLRWKRCDGADHMSPRRRVDVRSTTGQITQMTREPANGEHSDRSSARPGYHDPTAGIAGAAPARSALTLRAVLASFGNLTCAAAVVNFLVLGLPAWLVIVFTVAAVIGVVDLVVVVKRKARGEPG